MLNTKKILAAALAVTMVFGSSISAFADGPVTSGNTDGAGTSEGHLEKKVINVDLPTIAEGATPFSYTMDPERLISATSGAKHSGATFPAAEGDTGVYFLTAANTYANKSNTLTVTNKSSCDVTLSVKVKTTASAGGKDIALAESSTVATTGDPNLYLGLKVGDETTVVSATEQTITANIAGIPGNFETKVDNGAYAYAAKSDATGWKTIDISMEGAVSNLPIAADATAPTVNVTWSYAEAPTDAAPSISSTAATQAAAGQDVTFAVNLGAGTLAATSISGITFVKNGETRTLDAANYTFASGTLTFKATHVDALTAAREYTVKFNDSANTTVKVTVTPAS
ncbi:hypothetical protein [Butyrivibrio hungatei]|uniref:hypothetical protein n=1 Tax=Butyrivibrio hungatei TaxID=185008 RepID=UPI00040691F1|nr:hypothetical protein [Butyrivibrio hungatei]